MKKRPFLLMTLCAFIIGGIFAGYALNEPESAVIIAQTLSGSALTDATKVDESVIVDESAVSPPIGNTDEVWIGPQSVLTATGIAVTLNARLIHSRIPIPYEKTSASTEVAGSITAGSTAFTWDMGDGTDFITNTATVTHTYAAPGTYTVICSFPRAKIGEATVTVEDNLCADTILSPAGGLYYNPLAVAMSCNTPGSVIRYTTNGTDPTESNGTFYSVPVTVSATTTIKARAFASGKTPGRINTQVYTITGRVAKPVIVPASGIYRGNLTVSMSCSTPGASIRYSITGSASQSNLLYTGPFTLANGNYTISAHGLKPSWQDSEIVASGFKVTSQNAGGYLDGANGNTIWGWAWQPSWPNDPIDVHLYVDGQFKAAVSANQFRSDLQGPAGNGYHAFNYAMDWTFYTKGTHQVVAYAVDGSNVNPQLTGSPKNYTVGDYVYRITASDRAAGHRFGNAVAVYGDWAAVGEPNQDSYKGAVYIFKRQNNAWVQTQKIMNPYYNTASSSFGMDVSLENDTLIIGAPVEISAIGAVYIYKLSGGTWYYEQRLTAAGGYYNESFGEKVLKTGSRIFVSALTKNNYKGAVYIYNSTGGYNYYQEAMLQPSSLYDSANFGNALACYGDTLVIGAYGNYSGYGTVYIYKYSGSWYLYTTLSAPTIPGVSGPTLFGRAVTMNSSTIVVTSSQGIFFYDLNGNYLRMKGKSGNISACLDNNNLIVGDGGTNSATLYKFDGTNWVNYRTITPPQILNPQWYGGSVALRGNFMLIGAEEENDCGAAYFYNLLQF